MKPRCVDAVRKASRRPLTDGQIKAIEDRLSSTMRNLARQDPERWSSLTGDQRVAEASQAAQVDIQAEAARKLQNAERQIGKVGETDNRIASIREAGGGTRTDATKRDLLNADHYIGAIRRELDGALMDTIRAARRS